MTKTLSAQPRLLIAFIISAPTLLGVFWLFQNGFRNVAAAVFFMLFLADFSSVETKAGASDGPASCEDGNAVQIGLGGWSSLFLGVTLAPVERCQNARNVGNWTRFVRNVGEWFGAGLFRAEIAVVGAK